MSTRTDLGDLALDFKDKILARVNEAAADEAKIIQWGASQLQEAADKWRDEQISEAIFKDWLTTVVTIRVPAQTGALAKHESKKWIADLLGGVFKALAILGGAIV